MHRRSEQYASMMAGEGLPMLLFGGVSPDISDKVRGDQEPKDYG
jgi:hypothetical protein